MNEENDGYLKPLDSFSPCSHAAVNDNCSSTRWKHTHKRVHAHTHAHTQSMRERERKRERETWVTFREITWIYIDFLELTLHVTTICLTLT